MRTKLLWLGFLLASSVAVAAPVNAVGSNTAPITMEVFSDFECAHCALFHRDTLPAVISDHVKTGKVYLIHREFPLPGHKYSRRAACYATAAASIGRYQQVADALFLRQAWWSTNGEIEKVVASVLTPAELAKVRKLVLEPQTEAAVQKDFDAGMKAGINQTPTIILTHRVRQYPLSGAVAYPMLRRLLDGLLSQ
jgi:protein-disulfide isomerase